MSVFIDTSAFLAVLDADDRYHLRAKKEWIRLVQSGEKLFCNNYVLVESFALIQHRLGMEAVKAFQEDILPVVEIEWIAEEDHRKSVRELLVAGRRKLSLVDCVSFHTMKRMNIKTAFTFDQHFNEQGFESVP